MTPPSDAAPSNTAPARGDRHVRWRGSVAFVCVVALAGAAARPVAASGSATQPGVGSSAAGTMLLLADQALRPIAEGSIRIRSTVERSGEETVVSEIEVLVQGGDHALCIFRAGPLAGRRILM